MHLVPLTAGATGDAVKGILVLIRWPLGRIIRVVTLVGIIGLIGSSVKVIVGISGCLRAVNDVVNVASGIGRGSTRGRHIDVHVGSGPLSSTGIIIVVISCAISVISLTVPIGLIGTEAILEIGIGSLEITSVWGHVSKGIVVLTIQGWELVVIWGHCSVIILGVLVVLWRLTVIVVRESSTVVIIWEPSSIIGIATRVTINVRGHSIRGITHRRVTVWIRITISSTVHWIRWIVIIVIETIVNGATVFMAPAAAAAAITAVPLYAVKWGISMLHVDLQSSGFDVIVAQKALEMTTNDHLQCSRPQKYTHSLQHGDQNEKKSDYDNSTTLHGVQKMNESRICEYRKLKLLMPPPYHSVRAKVSQLRWWLIRCVSSEKIGQ